MNVDPVRNFEYVRHVVAHENDREAAGAHVANQIEHFATLFDAKRRGRLIEDHHFRAEGGCARHRNALALAARERLHGLMEIPNRHEPELAELLVCELLHRRTIELTKPPAGETLHTKLAAHEWASYMVVPVFAFANAGVDLRDGVLLDALGSRLTWAVVVALVVGKFLGIGLASWAGVRAGLGRLPLGVGFGHVFGGAVLSGIGFTVSLLIAGLALSDPQQHDQAVVGILIAAVLATVLGWVAFRAAAVFRGEGDADLPRFLDRPIDPAVDHIRGPVDAPLTLVEYGDYECPFCSLATGVARELGERFGDDLRFVFRQLPLADVHPHAELAAQAAIAAGAQGRFWEMHDLLFAHQDQLEYEDIAGYAADLDLDVEQFLRDLDDDDIAEHVRADVASAEASGARGTPTFFVGDHRHTGPHDTETLARALESSRQASVRPPQRRGSG